MDINKFLESKLFKTIIIGVLSLIVLLFVFKAGMFIGARRADFAFKWGENYHRNFVGPKKGFFNEFIGKNFIDANGVFGQIIKIDGHMLIIKDARDVEKAVLVKEDTVIRRFKDDLKLSDLKLDDVVVVIGEPNDNGQIEAKLIRMLPPPPVSLRTDIHKLNNF